MKLFASANEEDAGQQIWCCSISASPQELRKIAKFIEKTAKEMEEKAGKLTKDWHRHYPEYSDSDAGLAVGFPDLEV